MKNIHLLLLSLCLLIALPSGAVENEGQVHEQHADAKAGKFQPGEFIMGHIGDAYEWHLFTVGETHVSIPLPVILYSKTSGIHLFMSSKFHHGHSSFEGFQIASEGDCSGKIVEMVDGQMVRPLDLSMTKIVVSMLISMALLLWIFISVARAYAKREGHAPKGIQSWVEPIILFVRDEIAKPAIGEKKYEKFMPFLLTLFFFVWLNNLLGLIPFFPGGANVTGNITITMVLALFTFIITTINGNKNYWQHIFNAPGVPWWLKIPVPLMPIVELFGVFTKPFVLMVRLFANITAGHMIAMAFFSLIFIFGGISLGAGYGISVVSILFTVFMSLLELLVAVIQAYVFTLLSALYFGMAIEEHH